MSEDNSTDAAPKKSRKGLIIALTSVLLLGAGGAGAFMMLGGDSAKGEAGHDEANAKAEVKSPPLFVELDPPFVANFAPGSPARFLQVSVQLMTRDAELAKQLVHLDPIIRNDLLLLFGNQRVAEVSTTEGKEALRNATLEAVRKVIAAEGGKPAALEAVYFTSFVMQ
jgi:flagellar FliL protein